MNAQKVLMQKHHQARWHQKYNKKFCEEGNDTKDFSAISKVIGGDAWDYPID